MPTPKIEQRSVWARWALLLLFALVIPLPYYSSTLRGTAPFLLLLLVAIGNFSLVGATFAGVYAVLLYWVAHKTADYVLWARPHVRSRALIAIGLTMLVLAASPLYGFGALHYEFRNLYVFTYWELFKVGGVHTIPVEYMPRQ